MTVFTLIVGKAGIVFIIFYVFGHLSAIQMKNKPILVLTTHKLSEWRLYMCTTYIDQ